MTNPKTESAGTHKKEELCDKASKLAGDLARQLYVIKKQVEKQLVKLSKSSYQVARQALRKGKKAVKNSAVICKGLELKWKLWHGEQKRQVLFTRLGAEISRLHKDDIQDVFHHPGFKALIKQIREIEQTIEKARKTVEDKQPKKDKRNKPRQRTGSKKQEAGPEPV